MSEATIFFIADDIEATDPTAEKPLSPRAKVLVLLGLSLAAWVPVILPLVLFFHR